VYEIVGRYQDAVDEYSEAVKLNPENSDVHFNLGWALMESKRYIEALVPLKKSIRLNPKNTDAYYSLGWVYGELKRYEEAVVALEETLLIDPNHLEAGTRLNTMRNHLQELTAKKQDQTLTATSVLHDKFEIIVTP
jgi:tetratricopeptide (TPR) repeat protein